MSSLLSAAKAKLIACNTDSNSPFRLFWLSSVKSDANSADVRIVVNRGIDTNLDVSFYTDSRSDKVTQVLKHPQVCALFWDPVSQLQVRLYGEASILSSSHPEFVSALKGIQDTGHTQDYQSINPPGDTLVTQEQPEHVPRPIHFAVVKIHASKLDILQLSAKGHRRAICSLKGATWQEQEATP